MQFLAQKIKAIQDISTKYRNIGYTDKTQKNKLVKQFMKILPEALGELNKIQAVKADTYKFISDYYRNLISAENTFWASLSRDQKSVLNKSRKKWKDIIDSLLANDREITPDIKFTLLMDKYKVLPYSSGKENKTSELKNQILLELQEMVDKIGKNGYEKVKEIRYNDHDYDNQLALNIYITKLMYFKGDKDLNINNLENWIKANSIKDNPYIIEKIARYSDLSGEFYQSEKFYYLLALGKKVGKVDVNKYIIVKAKANLARVSDNIENIETPKEKINSFDNMLEEGDKNIIKELENQFLKLKKILGDVKLQPKKIEEWIKSDSYKNNNNPEDAEDTLNQIAFLYKGLSGQ